MSNDHQRSPGPSETRSAERQLAPAVDLVAGAGVDHDLVHDQRAAEANWLTRVCLIMALSDPSCRVLDRTKSMLVCA